MSNAATHHRAVPAGLTMKKAMTKEMSEEKSNKMSFFIVSLMMLSSLSYS